MALLSRLARNQFSPICVPFFGSPSSVHNISCLSFSEAGAFGMAPFPVLRFNRACRL